MSESKIMQMCQSGGKTNSKGRVINEDAVACFEVVQDGKKYKYTILMDGASGLGKNNEIKPEHTSAEWYVSFIIESLRETFHSTPGLEIKDAIQECIRKADSEVHHYEDNKQIKLEEFEIPSASLAIVREDEQKAEIFLLGDTETIIGYKDGHIERVDNPNQTAVQNNDNAVMERMAEIATSRRCSVIDTMKDPEIQEMLQRNRAKKNRPCKGGYWICGTNPEAVEHGVYMQIPKKEIDAIILATDGFNYSYLNLTPEQLYNEIRKKGFDHLARMIRAEEDADPGGNRHKRFKKGDDLSIVVIDESAQLENSDKDKIKGSENSK